MIQTRTALYRHLDAKGKLLYVGIAKSVLHRLAHHAASPWYYDISSVTIEYFDTRQQAMSAEKEAIKKESPLYNKKHKVKPLTRLEELFKQLYIDLSEPSDPDVDVESGLRFTSGLAAVTFFREYHKYHKKMEKLKAANAHPALSEST